MEQDAGVLEAVTAGSILRYGSHFVFQTGLNRNGDALGVVRLGGHVERGETAIECAKREAFEEGCVDISIESATATWSYETAGDDFELVPVDDELAHPAPLLVASMAPDPGLSVTYLASCSAEPTPGHETQAIIFLRPCDVAWLTTEAMRLADFLQRGGSLIEAVDLPRGLVLRPHAQLRALGQLLRDGAIPIA